MPEADLLETCSRIDVGGTWARLAWVTAGHTQNARRSVAKRRRMDLGAVGARELAPYLGRGLEGGAGGGPQENAPARSAVASVERRIRGAEVKNGPGQGRAPRK